MAMERVAAEKLNCSLSGYAEEIQAAGGMAVGANQVWNGQ
jgi:hypothetical protein